MSSSSSASAVPPEDDVCSVCHDRFRIPCQANCSHWFCGKFPLPLPLPRPFSHSEDLIRPFVSTRLRQEKFSRPMRQASENCQLLGYRNNGAYRARRLQDLPFFIRRLFRELMDPQRTLPLVFRARMLMMVALSAIYVLSPVDILPESVLGLFGFVDDLLILLIVFLHLAAVYRSLLLYRHGGQ
ncbi:hypothetical protein HU200_010978 [Digitaria exilis]|uniref:DUF1232 domain-containing protein n=1 Tax=Digitaria exilis TaxID=1010633 RepID=A0A835FH80_9POAL|nr:hypothetical protein HU200_010978 [Digitaria exilis]